MRLPLTGSRGLAAWCLGGEVWGMHAELSSPLAHPTLDQSPMAPLPLHSSTNI